MIFKNNIEHIEKFDVVVAGGGVAGFAAAVAAARNGAKTALIEDLGALGGILTLGGNPEIGIFYAYNKQAIAGIGWELCKRLEKEGFADIPDFSVVDTRDGCSKSNVKVNPVMAQVEMNRMCIEAGVKLFLHTKVIAADMEENRIIRLIAAEKCGLVGFEADVYIDCTGDGDVAKVSGAEMYTSDVLQPGTYGYTFKCNNLSELKDSELRADFEKCKEKGTIKHGDYWPEFHGTILGFLRGGGNNANHINMDCSNAKGKTKAEIDGREAMARMINFAEEHADITLFSSAAYAAPRETKRIVCDYTITIPDFMTGKIFDDSLAYGYYNMDLHSSANTDGSRPFALDKEFEKLPDGIVPTIPLKAQTVKGIYNLLTAGRCISGVREVMGALRVKCPCMSGGEAVGTVAALTESGNVRGVDIEKVKDTLRKNGAIVPDSSLFKPKG